MKYSTRSQGMRRPAAIGITVFLGACAIAAPISSGPLVSLVQGEQLKMWCVDASRTADGITVTGQVNRTAQPRGPLREHVHVETLDAAGQVLAVHDATIYPVVALRGQGRARLSSTLSDHEATGDVNLRLRVVEGVPHD